MSGNCCIWLKFWDKKKEVVNCNIFPFLTHLANPQLPLLSWTNGCKAEKRQRWKLILMALYASGSTKENLYILWCKITQSERSVIQQNQIMLTLMVCLRLGAIIKQEWQVFITKALCGPEWIDNTLKLISYKYIPLEDLWSQSDCSLKWNNEKLLNDKNNFVINRYFIRASKCIFGSLWATTATGQ